MTLILGTDGADAKLGPNGEDNTFILFGGNDSAFGGDQQDFMNGGSGNDNLGGGAGNDTLIGSGGSDSMTGGSGADIFQYFGLEDSPVGVDKRDVIFFFEKGVDKIDLQFVDANTQVLGDQDFTFIRASSFSGKAGQLRADHNPLTGNMLVEADVNGDKLADMQIELIGISPNFNKTDFVL
jgi:Ca2+-binding RTX toxin-like protein